ncbi:MAG: hypothetical protein HRU15_15910 [Planctomycetes bacterium]|nr:hypothetical protein [Planctomycetota bacterium]
MSHKTQLRLPHIHRAKMYEKKCTTEKYLHRNTLLGNGVYNTLSNVFIVFCEKLLLIITVQIALTMVSLLQMVATIKILFSGSFLSWGSKTSFVIFENNNYFTLTIWEIRNKNVA